MLRNIFISIHLLFMSCAIYAQTKTYDITLALSLDDCLNCNKALYDFSHYKSKYHIRVVMKKELQFDSAYINNKYQIVSVADEWLWSDSLFKIYSPFGTSTVTLESKYMVNAVSLPVREIYSRDFLNFLNRQTKNTDTLFPKVDKALKGVTDLEFGNTHLGTLVNYKDEVLIYDYLSQKLRYRINISDSILAAIFAFNDSNIPASEYKARKERMIAEHVPKLFNISRYEIVEDTVFLSLKESYFHYPSDTNQTNFKRSQDTLLLACEAMLKYVKGQLVSIKKVQQRIFFDKASILGLSNFHYHDGKFYQELYYQDKKPQWFNMGRLVENDTLFQLKIYPRKTVDKALLKAPLLVHQIYDRGTFAHITLPKIFSIEDNSVVEQIDNYKNPHELNNESILNGWLIRFKLSDEYLWYIVNRVDEGRKVKLYKMNRKTRAIETSTTIFDNTFQLLEFDPINPDFILYKDDKGQLIRERAFEQ
jgi:hypothetical protein